MAFRLLWWLEEGCLGLLISKAPVETPLCLHTALHCATEMSPCAENRLLPPSLSPLYHPCSLHLVLSIHQGCLGCEAVSVAAGCGLLQNTAGCSTRSQEDNEILIVQLYPIDLLST